MKDKPIPCPSCGQPAAGKFCGHCGASLTGRASQAPWNAKTIVPWVALGIATFALAVALMALFDRGRSAEAPAPELPAFSATVPSAANPPDLASMSPREAADRLFNRVMKASESGDVVEASRFTPMALLAYNNLGTLDNDARYHLALLHLTAGDSKSARVQVELLRKAVPNHLLGLMVEHQIAERSGNKDSAARAIKAFLAAYDVEIATQKDEYQDHLITLDRFRKSAQPGVAGKK